MRRLTIAAFAVLAITACNNGDEQTTEELTLPTSNISTSFSDLTTLGLKGKVHTVHRNMYRKFAQDGSGTWTPTDNKVTEYIETYDQDGYKIKEVHIQNGDTLREMITEKTGDHERKMVMYNNNQPIAIQAIKYNGGVTLHKIYQVSNDDTNLITQFSKTYKPDGRSFITEELNTEKQNKLSIDYKTIDDSIITVQKGAEVNNVSKQTILSRDEQGNITQQLFQSDIQKGYDVLTNISYTYYE